MLDILAGGTNRNVCLFLYLLLLLNVPLELLLGIFHSTRVFRQFFIYPADALLSLTQDVCFLSLIPIFGFNLYTLQVDYKNSLKESSRGKKKRRDDTFHTVIWYFRFIYI